MKHLIAALMASVALLTISASPSFADSKMSNMKMNTMKAMHMCPKGKHWVNGYMNKMHHKVAGYCRRG